MPILEKNIINFKTFFGNPDFLDSTEICRLGIYCFYLVWQINYLLKPATNYLHLFPNITNSFSWCLFLFKYMLITIIKVYLPSSYCFGLKMNNSLLNQSIYLVNRRMNFDCPEFLSCILDYLEFCGINMNS